jgi:hypothetical protein
VILSTCTILAVVALGPIPDLEGPHRGNGLYRSMIEEGVTIAGRRIPLPAPSVPDGLSGPRQTTVLRELAGSERALAELLRDSVSAPFILKVHDEAGEPSDLIRKADLWFAIHADFDAMDPDATVRQASDANPVEAGNMRFQSHLLDSKALSAQRPGDVDSKGAVRRWFVHISGRLLDRIEVDETVRVDATKSDASWVIASRTDPRFDDDATYPNRWRPIVRRGGRDEPGKASRYDGGASYVKISRLADVAGTLLVETHFAFAEPRAWFDGAPILRSKISLIAQDQVRRLRREVAKTRDHPKTVRPGR